MFAASDSRSVGLNEHFRRARVQRPPPPPTITSVIARRPTTAPTAPVSGPCVRSHRHHDRPVDIVHADPFYDRARQPTRLLPYLGVQHPVCRPFSFEPSTARNLGIRRGAPADRPSTHPRTQQKGPISLTRTACANRPGTARRCSAWCAISAGRNDVPVVLLSSFVGRDCFVLQGICDERLVWWGHVSNRRPQDLLTGPDESSR